MIPLEKLLEPISPERPSGEDPHGTGSLFQLEQLIKAESEAEEGSEPDWAKVRESALQILQGSKDLRVGVILTLALLRREGIPGFRDGLKLLRGYVEKFWDSVFPLLDQDEPEDDPTRANALNSLSPPLGKEGPYRFVGYLRQIPLSHSQRLSNYGLRDIHQAKDKSSVSGKEQQPQVTLTQIEAAFRDTSESSVKKLQETHEGIKEALGLLEGLEKAFEEKCAGGITPSFETLRATLQAMIDWVAQYVQVTPASLDQPGSVQTEQAGMGPVAVEKTGSTATGHRGSIESPADVEAALQVICAYYKQRDRSSPVPFFLERALRLLDKDFMQSVGDLAPESVKELNKLFGLAAQPPNQEKK